MLILLEIEEGGKFIAGKGKLRFKVRGVEMTKGLEAGRKALIHGKRSALIITREPNDPRSVLERLEIHIWAGKPRELVFQLSESTLKANFYNACPAKLEF